MQQPLVELFGRKDVCRFPAVASAVESILAENMAALFEKQRDSAPRRGDRKSYFMRHDGCTTSGLPSNRREEHLAIALWRRYRTDGFALQDGLRLFPLDYQFPLKSHNNSDNQGIGKVDLLCASDAGQPWVIELKVHPSNVRRSPETPLKALLEALAYTAILDANLECICAQCRVNFPSLSSPMRPRRPHLMVLAPSEYWTRCESYEKDYPARAQVTALRRRIRQTVGVASRFVSMSGCCWNPPCDGCGPMLMGEPLFQSVDDDE